MNKDKTMSFRLTDEDAKTIKNAAEKQNMDLSSFITQCCLNNNYDAKLQHSYITLINMLHKSMGKLKKNYLEPDEFIKIMEDLLDELDN